MRKPHRIAPSKEIVLTTKSERAGMENGRLEEFKNSGFIIIPYDEYLNLVDSKHQIKDIRFRYPPEVVSDIDNGIHPVRAWRTYKKLSMRDMAKKSGLHRNTIFNIETGIIQPRRKTLEAVAYALMIDPEQLLHE